MKTLSTADIPSYVSFVDSQAKGDLRSAIVAEKYFPLNLVYKTVVDESLSPFSDEYYNAQVALYGEISGKELDQWSGELHPVNIDALLDAPNPLGINNVEHISENVRALSAMLAISGLRENANVLDMGAGHGLSSEVYAFCGCKVHSIDIDPMLCELAEKRAKARSLRIIRSIMNFDSLVAIKNNAYDAAFFFQSLHHCLRPWKLIEELKTKLNENGIIGFCGEPVQNNWWKHWGIRLDPESIYVARKYGWFESGWSSSFIIECFKRNGMRLILLQGGHRAGMIGIASKNEATLDAIVAKAAELGMDVVDNMTIEVSMRNYRTQIGKFLASHALRPSIQSHASHQGGYLCFGPYISLPAGRYRVSFMIECLSRDPESDKLPVATVDCIGFGGKVVLYSEKISPVESAARIVDFKFDLKEDATLIEARVHIPNKHEVWNVSLPMFEKVL